MEEGAVQARDMFSSTAVWRVAATSKHISTTGPIPYHNGSHAVPQRGPHEALDAGYTQSIPHEVPDAGYTQSIPHEVPDAGYTQSIPHEAPDAGYTQSRSYRLREGGE